jgi:AcrR family transcriptional regulator
MGQRQRSERSQSQILEAALELFSHQGYRGTTVREIAAAAGLSTGSVYHHFPDKESIFRTLLDRYWQAIAQPDHPFNRALADGAFPTDLERLGRAARQSIEQYRPYVSLIYVDVVEFGGRHIRKFYSQMAGRFQRFLTDHYRPQELEQQLKPGVSPVTAVMLASRFLLHYFAVELIFGVPDHFGHSSDETLSQVAEILRHGMLRPNGQATVSEPTQTKIAQVPPVNR